MLEPKDWDKERRWLMRLNKWSLEKVAYGIADQCSCRMPPTSWTKAMVAEWVISINKVARGEIDE